MLNMCYGAGIVPLSSHDPKVIEVKFWKFLIRSTEQEVMFILSSVFLL